MASDEKCSRTSASYNLPGYCQNEDVDMTFRVGQSWKILQTPHAKLLHKSRR